MFVASERRDQHHRSRIARPRYHSLADNNEYALPLTQTELADLMGLTNVHVDRTLRALREDGLNVLRRTHLTIPDVGRLEAFCSFDPTYLHLNMD